MKKKMILLALLLFGSFAMMACNLGVTPPDDTDPDQVLVDDAAGRLNALFPTRGETVSNLTFPTTMIHGVTASWSSSHPGVISNTGQVTRPIAGDPNAVVTITVTLTLNDASAERAIEFIVIALPVSTAYTDFALLHSESSNNDDVEVEGVVVSVFQAGYFLYDGTNYIGVYKPSHNVVSLGDRVVVLGKYSFYYTLWQVGSVTSEVVLTSGNDTTVPVEEKTVQQVDELDTAANRLLNGRTYKVQGMVTLVGAYENVAIVDGDNSLLVYYLSNTSSIAALETFVGQIVEIEIIYYTHHTMDGTIVVFQGGIDDITVVELGEQDAFDTDVNNAAATPNYTFGGNITLPASGANGTLFTDWVSSHPTLIAHDGTFVDEPTAPTVVTFTGTATLGTITGPVTITVDALALMTIAEAINVVGKHVIVEGIISQYVPANSGFFIYDGTGYMYIRDTGLFSTFQTNYAVGDVIQVVAVRGNYRGIYQLSSVKAHEASLSTYPMPVSVGPVAVTDVIAGVYPAGTIVEITGLVVDMQTFYGDWSIYDGDNYLQIHHNSNNGIFADYVGDIVTVEVVVFQWDHTTPYVAFFGTADDITVGEMSDADKVAAALVALDLGDTSMVISDLDLPLIGDYDAAITWESDNLAALLNDGTIIRGTVDVTVNLTATVTINLVSDTKVFVIVIKDETFGAMSVADALLEVDGTTVLIEAVVHSINENRFGVQGYFIQDLDGTSIYLNGSLTGDLAVGNKIIVQGDLQTYASFGNTQRRLASAGLTLVSNDAGSHAVVIVDNVSMNGIVTAYPASSSVRYRVENVVISQYDGFNAIHFVTGETMRIKFDARDYVTYFKNLYEVGDTVAWIEFTVYDINFDNMRVVDIVLPDLTQAQIEIILGNMMNIPAETATDITLPTLLTVEGVDYTVVWESSAPTIISNTGVVVQPEFGLGNAIVTLTATIEYDLATDFIYPFTVTVLEATEPGVAASYVHDFGTVSRTGYAAGDLTWSNTDALPFTESKDRVQINISTNAPHATQGAFVVMAPISTFQVAWMEFDLSTYAGISKVEFTYSTWSGTSYTNINNTLTSALLTLEFYDTVLAEWVVVGTVDLQVELDATQYLTASFNVTEAGLYRIVYTTTGATTTTNTAYAITVDDFAIFE